MFSSRNRLFAATLTIFVIAGCGDDSGSDDAGIDATDDRNSMTESGPAPMGDALPIECTENEQCDDGVGCTRDICNGAGQCIYAPDIAACDDGVFCNGVEICDPLDGCIAGPPETCSDDDVCTLDRCVEETKTCEHSPRDFDMDGEADWHCEGGTDCDDRNPARGSTASELCGDMIDNDCDEVIDETLPEAAEACGRPEYDVCEDALDVSAGGLFEIDTTGAVSDYSLTCTSWARKDVVISFTLTESKDIRIEADGRSSTTLGLRTTCGDRSSETDCATGYPGVLRARALAAGTYYVIVMDIGGSLLLDVEFLDPTEAPANITCDAPTDVSAGGMFTGNFVDVSDDTRLSCGSSLASDLFYQFTTTEAQDVSLEARSLTGEQLYVSVRTTCSGEDPMTMEPTELRCRRDAPAQTRLRSLPAGTYFIVLESLAGREVDFALNVAFDAPTMEPAGESCAAPIALPHGTDITGDLTGAEDDIALTCSRFNADQVYALTLTDRSDVLVTANGGRTMYLSLRPTCDSSTGALRCSAGSPSRARARDLAPGTYYVIVESYRGGTYTVRADVTPPTMVTPVMGNDTCGTAHLVPETGGLYTGDTSILLNDVETSMCGAGAASKDAVFRLELSASKRVVASTDGSSFDTVLHMHQTSCMTRAELVCDDDGGDGSASMINRVLGAGTHYFVVDGFGGGASGDYTFEVTVTEP